MRCGKLSNAMPKVAYVVSPTYVIKSFDQIPLSLLARMIDLQLVYIKKVVLVQEAYNHWSSPLTLDFICT
jgi:hypothetical protein